MGKLKRSKLTFALATMALLGTSAAGLAQEPTQLNIMVFGGTLGNGFMEAIKGFEEENNVQFEVTQSTAVQAITRLLARRGQEPEFDIAHMSPSAHFQGAEAGIWEEITPELVPNMAEILPFAVDRDKYVGWGVLAFGLEANVEAIEEAGAEVPTAWADLWKPEFEGKVAVEDFSNAYGQAFFDMIAQSRGGQDEAFAALRELRDSICCFPFSPAEVDNLLLQEEAWLAPNSDTRTNLLAAKGAPVRFIYPTDGAGAWLVHLDIPKNSPRREMALKLMNYVLSPEIQSRLAQHAKVGPVNPNAEVDPSLPVTKGEDLKNLIPIRWGEIVPNLQELTDRWTREFQN